MNDTMRSALLLVIALGAALAAWTSAACPSTSPLVREGARATVSAEPAHLEEGRAARRAPQLAPASKEAAPPVQLEPAAESASLDRPEDSPGALRVEVVDQDGAPVDRFCARVEDAAGRSRFVSADRAGGVTLVEGLALGDARVSLARAYVDPPTDYLPDEDMSRTVRLAPFEVGRVRFQVERGGRIAWTVDAAPAAGLAARVRAPGSEWLDLDAFWRFGLDGASEAWSLGDGTSLSEVLRAGTYELEVLEPSRATPRWRGFVELVPGATKEVRVRAPG